MSKIESVVTRIDPILTVVQVMIPSQEYAEALEEAVYGGNYQAMKGLEKSINASVHSTIAKARLGDDS